MNDIWKFDYDQRQYYLMMEQLNLFSEGKIKISYLISGLRGLSSALEMTEKSWKEAFINEWGTLEIVYAMALDRPRSSLVSRTDDVLLSVDECTLVLTAIKNLRKLVSDALDTDELPD